MSKGRVDSESGGPFSTGQIVFLSHRTRVLSSEHVIGPSSNHPQNKCPPRQWNTSAIHLVDLQRIPPYLPSHSTVIVSQNLIRPMPSLRCSELPKQNHRMLTSIKR